MTGRQCGFSLPNEARLMISAKSSAASFGYAGAAGVKFPTAGISSSTLTFAMDAVVGFATFPPAPSKVRMRSKLMPVSTSTPETKNARVSGAPIPSRGLDTGQPLETVRGGVHRQRVGHPNRCRSW